MFIKYNFSRTQKKTVTQLTKFKPMPDKPVKLIQYIKCLFEIYDLKCSYLISKQPSFSATS